MNLRHLLRMKRLAERPPSNRRVALVFGTIAICLVIAGAEWLFGPFPFLENWDGNTRIRVGR
ncbi:MAG: hypothetical protein AAF667_03165 [Pseudomonadota bacterium]